LMWRKPCAKAPLVGDEAAKCEGREDQIAFSLAAIGRIAPGPFEEYLPPFVERLGRELDDGKVLILCRYIEPESRIWDWLGRAGQTRILAKIDNASFSELVSVITPRDGLFATITPGIRLGPATKARHVAVVGERLLKRLKQGDQKYWKP
jgi:hypothetical protein